jgi:hypothetical protein
MWLQAPQFCRSLLTSVQRFPGSQQICPCGQQKFFVVLQQGVCPRGQQKFFAGLQHVSSGGQQKFVKGSQHEYPAGQQDWLLPGT